MMTPSVASAACGLSVTYPVSIRQPVVTKGRLGGSARPKRPGTSNPPDLFAPLWVSMDPIAPADDRGNKRRQHHLCCTGDPRERPRICSGYRPGGVGSGPDFSTGSPDGFTLDFRVEGDELYTEIVKPLKQAPYLATHGSRLLGSEKAEPRSEPGLGCG